MIEPKVVEPKVVVEKVVKVKPVKELKVKEPKVKPIKEPKEPSKASIARTERSARKRAELAKEAVNRARALAAFEDQKAAEALLPPVRLVTMEETIAKMDIWEAERRAAMVGKPPVVAVDYKELYGAKSIEHRRTHYWRDLSGIRHPPTDPNYRTDTADKIQ